MVSGQESVFDRFARAVTIRDIQRKFAFTWDVVDNGHLESTLVHHFVEQFGALSSRPVLLTANCSFESNGCEAAHMPWGVYFPELAIRECFREGNLDLNLLADGDEVLDEGTCARATEMDPECIVSADTTLPDLFRNPPPHFEKCGAIVLDGARWTGVITADELMSPPAQMSYLATILELEHAATKLCRLFPQECMDALSEARRHNALAHFLRKLGPNLTIPASLDRHLPEASLCAGGASAAAAAWSLILDCTCLGDKANMVRKCKLTQEQANSKIRSVFGRAEELRDACAHPGADGENLPFSFGELRDLLTDATDLIRIFEFSFERECRARKISPTLAE